jgi:hypothetical protein
MILRRSVVCLLVAVALAACESPLELDPTASIDASGALTTPRSIELGTIGAYRSLTSGSLYGATEAAYPDLYADNLDFTGTFQTDREVSLRNISTENGSVLAIWQAAYTGIGRANQLLEAIPNITGLSDPDGYRAEALFIRSLHNMILVRYFGGVPIVLTPTHSIDEIDLPLRSTQADVYARIIADLEEAALHLPPTRQIGRASQPAALALLARAYLDIGNNALARDRATSLINNTAFRLNPVFRDNWAVKNSPESIFELQYTTQHTSSNAFWFFPSSLGGRRGYAPTLNLFNAYAATDTRRDATIARTSSGQRYGFKYFRISTEDDNFPVLRLAEMYLIRAEANARLGADPAVVRADINVVRARAGQPALATTVVAQQDLLNAILLERRLELAMEGHRFFDLRRFGVATTLLTITPERLLFPIPQAERDVNENLAQNPGY